MAANEDYKVVKRTVVAMLKSIGFKLRGRKLTRTYPEVCQLIEFQKSTSSDRHNARFTINVGICSFHVVAFYMEEAVDGRNFVPTLSDCQWNGRVGGFLPEPCDTWWTVGSESDPDVIGHEVVEALTQYVVPVLSQLTTDSSLVDEWKDNRFRGVPTIRGLMHLSVLLARFKDARLADVERELKLLSAGRPTSLMVRYHLARLEAIK